MTRRLATDGREPLGHRDHRARVGVERLGLRRVEGADLRAGAHAACSAPKRRGHGALVGAADHGQLERRRPPPARSRARRRAPRRRRSAFAGRRDDAGRRARCRPRPPGLPSSTARTSRPSRSGRPTALRRRRATRGGAIATPSRCGDGASPRASPRTRSFTAAPAGTARIRPPSSRRLLTPSRFPSGSTSGPPDEPRGSGAVCSMAPRDAAPARAAEAAPAGGDEAERGAQAAPAGVGERDAPACRCPGASPPAPTLTAGASPVSTASTARSRSVSTPATVAGLAAAVRERDGHLVAAQVVRAREHVPVGDHHAGAEAPAAAEAHDRRAHTLGRPRDRCPASVAIVFISAAPSTNLQIASDYLQHASTISAMTEPTTTPLAAALDSVGDRWTLLLVEALLDGPRRFGDLQEQLPRHRPERAHPAPAAPGGRGTGARPALHASARSASCTSSPPRATSWPARCACWPTGAPATARAGEPPRHDACGTPVEARWWCPTCEQPVDEDEAADLRFA